MSYSLSAAGSAPATSSRHAVMLLFRERHAELAWQLRRGFQTDLVLTPVEQAVERALATPLWPVILADQGNNTAGGSPGAPP